jgi:hypothetical protein
VYQLVAPFNSRVRGMLDGLNAGLPGATFIYLDNYRLFTLMLASPASYGKMAGVQLMLLRPAFIISKN